MENRLVPNQQLVGIGLMWEWMGKERGMKVEESVELGVWDVMGRLEGGQ